MARTIPVYAVIAPGTAVVIRRKSDTVKVVVLHIFARAALYADDANRIYSRKTRDFHRPIV
jgi:hypothetical protein